jgi:hypothetical protein
LVPALRAEFEQRWLRQARRSEIDLTLQHFDVLEQAYDRALAWLTDSASSGDLATYAPRPFAPLWEQGRQELRKLAEAAGVDALPPELRGWLAGADDRAQEA